MLLLPSGDNVAATTSVDNVATASGDNVAADASWDNVAAAASAQLI